MDESGRLQHQLRAEKPRDVHAHEVGCQPRGFDQRIFGGQTGRLQQAASEPSSYSTIVDGTLAEGGTIVQAYEYYDYLNYNNRTEVSYTLNGSQTGSDYPPALSGLASHGVTGSGPSAQHLLNLIEEQFRQHANRDFRAGIWVGSSAASWSMSSTKSFSR